MKNTRWIAFWSLVLTSLFILGCGGASSEVKSTYSGTYPIRVVCTTGMVADLVRNVGGPQVQVEQLIAADVDPHTYLGTDAEDVNKLSKAELIFYNGLHLEGQMGKTFENLSRKIPAFGVADYVHPKFILGETDATHDPHIWFDVQIWSEAAGVVAEILEKFDPSTKVDYRARLKKYQDELAILHEEAKKQIATIPKEQRVLVTSHDAFRYFGRAYDIEVKGIQGISTEAEPSLDDVEKVVKIITELKVKAVFVESSVNPRTMRNVIEGCAKAGHKVAEAGTLFSDAMGAEGTPEGTYLGMVRHNVNTIVKALK